MLVFISQSVRESRTQPLALPVQDAVTTLADRRERIRFLRNDATDKAKAAAGNIRILSSCYPQSKDEPTSALIVSYQLSSETNVSVRLQRSACRALMSHCELSNRNGYEVAGILAGHSREMRDRAGDPPRYCLDVTDVLPIESRDRSGSHISVDEQSWGSVERMLLDLSGSQDKCKLAWYHTHPTQGVFFSQGDWESHLLFPRPYQFALVVDPGSMQAGLFYWSDYDRKSQGQPLYFSLKQETE